MTTVFIAGSISINRLHKKVQERIGKIVSSDLDVVVGDADGADTSIQKCLRDYRAEKVTVYCSGDAPRNNVADWPVRNVYSKAKAGSRAYFTAKDLEMARKSDYGLMIWDCKSTGTLSNVIELLREKKKSVVFVNKSGDFIKVSNKAGLEDLLSFMSTHARAKAEEKINLSSVIAGISQEQLSLDVSGNEPSSSSEKAKQSDNASGSLPMSDHTSPKPWTEDLAEARQLAAGLSASLPDKVEIAALGVRLAGLAGVLLAPIAGVHPAMGAEILTAAFVVVVIGGLGSFWGVIAAAALVGVVRGITIYFNPSWGEASMYLLMAVVLLVRPRGLLGERIEKFE